MTISVSIRKRLGSFDLDSSFEAPEETYRPHVIMGRTFDPAAPKAYVDSFAIKRA